MPEPTLKFSVTCPHCALESVSEMAIALLANALLTGKAIRLYSQCHNHYWTATFVEREQIRKSLAAYSPARAVATADAPPPLAAPQPAPLPVYRGA